MTSPSVARRPRISMARLLYGDISATAWVAIFGLVAIFSLGRTLFIIVDEARNGLFGASLVEWSKEFVEQASMALVFIALIAPTMRLAPQRGARRAVVLSLALIAASSVAALVRILTVDIPVPSAGDPLTLLQFLDRFFVRYFVRYGYLATLVVVIAELQRYATQALGDVHRAEVGRLALDREMAAARLQVLQAQVEPHFLFNTLANVRRLYQTSAEAGRTMLDNLMRYLEVALPCMRDDNVTLEQEGGLLEAYLNVQKIRMGRRLDFGIEIPPALATLSVPPMMLLTLVENALKHGLGPLPEGGAVRIEARVESGHLEVRVSDNGRGFGDATSGAGTGLANIRGRLDAMFGERAALELSSNAPRGVTATLRVPIDEERA